MIYKGKKYPSKIRKLGSLIKYLKKPKASPKNLGPAKEFIINSGPLKNNTLLLRTNSTLPFKLKGHFGYYEKNQWVNLNG